MIKAFLKQLFGLATVTDLRAVIEWSYIKQYYLRIVCLVIIGPTQLYRKYKKSFYSEN